MCQWAIQGDYLLDCLLVENKICSSNKEKRVKGKKEKIEKKVLIYGTMMHLTADLGGVPGTRPPPLPSVEILSF